METNNIVKYLLIIGISFSILYAAIDSFLDSNAWIGFIPVFITDIIPENIILPIFSIYEILLGLWLLSSRKLLFSSILASLTLLAIIVFNLASFQIIFRDIPILLAAIALIFISIKDKGKKEIKLDDITKPIS